MLLLFFPMFLQTAQFHDPAIDLRAIINQQSIASHHFVLILRDWDVLTSLLPDQPTRYILSEKQPIRIKQSRGFLIFQGTMNLTEILNMTRWTSQTRFLLVHRRTQSSDLFVINPKYQDFNNKSLIMTMNDLQPFSKLILQDSNNVGGIWTDTKNIFNDFWAKRIQHAVVIIPQKTNIYVYSHFPFTENHCQDEITPTLINIYSSGNFFKPPNLFPDKLDNLFNCPLNVSVMEVPPGLMLKNRETLDGVEGKLVVQILSKLNATSRINVRQDPKWFGNFSAMDLLFWDIAFGTSDIGAGLLLPTFAEQETDMVNFCTTVCLAWAVPFHLAPRSSFLVMADVFEASVWYCVAYSIIVSMIIGSIFAQIYGKGDVFVKILSITFGQSTRIPQQVGLKILFVHFTWFVIVFSMVYQAGFGSNRIVLRPVRQLKTPRDVLESPIDLAGSFTAKQIFEKHFFGGNGVDIRAMDTQNGLIKVAYEQKTAFLGIRLTSKYFTRVIKPDLRNLIYLQEECLIQYHPALALKQSSPYRSIAETTVQLLVEAGFVEHDMKMYMSRVRFQGSSSSRRGVRRDPPPSVVVALWSIIHYGLGLSLFAFLLEHIVFYIGRRTREQQGLWVHH